MNKSQTDIKLTVVEKGHMSFDQEPIISLSLINIFPILLLSSVSSNQFLLIQQELLKFLCLLIEIDTETFICIWIEGEFLEEIKQCTYMT